jgi:DNA polymerase-1
MLVKVDAAGLEWRTLAWLANDKIAIEEINSGIDFHAKNQEYFKLPSRLIAKIYLFRTIYRGSGWAFSKDPAFNHVSTDPDYWDNLNRMFYRKYRGIDECHTRWAQLVLTKKPIVSPLGREWMIHLNEDGKLPWTVLTNYPVQGTGADVVCIARLSLRRRLREGNFQSLLIGTVHDDIRLDCPSGEVDEVAQICYSVFDDITKNIKRIWNVDVPVQFPGEVYKGNNFRDLELVQREYKH